MARLRRPSSTVSPFGMPAQASAWFGLALDSWMLGAEAAQVATLRLGRLAGGGERATREATLMVTEKIAAGIELQTQIVSGALGFAPLDTGAGAVAHYRRKVRANRRRLNRSGR